MAAPLVKTALAGLSPISGWVVQDRCTFSRRVPASRSLVISRSRYGEALLLKGYGYSDLKSKTPVDPTSTIFRLASISKLFTWICAMQLVEQGKLDRGINRG
ncbi:MAG: serine hydrolase domain-containing protein [Steroidobacteraceae bacterium]